MPEAERLIAFEAAMQELGSLQDVATRYRPLHDEAHALLGELMDLGRDLRQARRRGVFTDEVAEERAGHVRRLREAWYRRLADLRASGIYRQTLAAYAAGDQAALAELVPGLFTGVSPEERRGPFFRPLGLTSHRRSGGSPFRPPETIAAEVEALARDGLRPHFVGREWWDTDLPAIVLAAELGTVEAPAALRLEPVPAPLALFRERDTVLVFAPRLEVELRVVLAASSDDAWYEAVEGSYETYRDAVIAALRARSVAASVEPAWS